jgi:hypothetical protein
MTYTTALNDHSRVVLGSVLLDLVALLGLDLGFALRDDVGHLASYTSAHASAYRRKHHLGSCDAARG